MLYSLYNHKTFIFVLYHIIIRHNHRLISTLQDHIGSAPTAHRPPPGGLYGAELAPPPYRQKASTGRAGTIDHHRTYAEGSHSPSDGFKNDPSGMTALDFLFSSEGKSEPFCDVRSKLGINPSVMKSFSTLLALLVRDLKLLPSPQPYSNVRPFFHGDTSFRLHRTVSEWSEDWSQQP